MSRDIQEAARSLAKADHDYLRLIAAHDPDMIRDVARAAIRPIWKPHLEDCPTNDSEFGACSCGAEHAALLECAEARS